MTNVEALIVYITIVICVIVVTAYITVLICNYKFNSYWQPITYMGSSVEPKCIYICKKCNNKSDINCHYCDNCGAKMMNGVERIYYTNGIKLDLDE